MYRDECMQGHIRSNKCRFHLCHAWFIFWLSVSFALHLCRLIDYSTTLSMICGQISGALFCQIFVNILGSFWPDVFGPGNTVYSSTGAEKYSVEYYSDRASKLFYLNIPPITFVSEKPAVPKVTSGKKNGKEEQKRNGKV